VFNKTGLFWGVSQLLLSMIVGFACCTGEGTALTESRGGAVLRALASHQCGLSLIPDLTQHVVGSHPFLSSIHFISLDQERPYDSEVSQPGTRDRVRNCAFLVDNYTNLLVTYFLPFLCF